MAGCASTAFTVTPSPQAPVCERSATARVLRAAEWRAEQKDVVEREAAAAASLRDFFGSSAGFARSELRRTQRLSPTAVLRAAHCASRSVRPDRLDRRSRARTRGQAAVSRFADRRRRRGIAARQCVPGGGRGAATRIHRSLATRRPGRDEGSFLPACRQAGHAGRRVAAGRIGEVTPGRRRDAPTHALDR